MGRPQSKDVNQVKEGKTETKVEHLNRPGVGDWSNEVARRCLKGGSVSHQNFVFFLWG